MELCYVDSEGFGRLVLKENSSPKIHLFLLVSWKKLRKYKQHTIY